jgi:hypothetical protein
VGVGFIVWGSRGGWAPACFQFGCFLAPENRELRHAQGQKRVTPKAVLADSDPLADSEFGRIPPAPEILETLWRFGGFALSSCGVVVGVPFRPLADLLSTFGGLAFSFGGLAVYVWGSVVFMRARAFFKTYQYEDL